jgi:TetR/AcrR family transcriptional regulator, transcriptional repressor for nem operon
MKSQTDTRRQILDIGEKLLLDRGYNGFSYSDISRVLNIKNASIHYHFPQKTDLGVAIIRRAVGRFEKWALSMEKDDIPYSKKLHGYCLLFKKYVEQDQQICLGGALETDFKTLPLEMREETRTLATRLVRWLEKILEEGKGKGEFSFPGPPGDYAFVITSALQGAVQNVRVTGPAWFDKALKEIVRLTCT